MNMLCPLDSAAAQADCRNHHHNLARWKASLVPMRTRWFGGRQRDTTGTKERKRSPRQVRLRSQSRQAFSASILAPEGRTWILQADPTLDVAASTLGPRHRATVGILWGCAGSGLQWWSSLENALVPGPGCCRTPGSLEPRPCLQQHLCPREGKRLDTGARPGLLSWGMAGRSLLGDSCFFRGVAASPHTSKTHLDPAGPSAQSG